MKSIAIIILLTISVRGISQGDVTKEFQYPNFIKYYKEAKIYVSKNDYLKAEKAIKNAEFTSKGLIKKGFESDIKTKLDELKRIKKIVIANKTKTTSSVNIQNEIFKWKGLLETFYKSPFHNSASYLEKELQQFDRGYMLTIIKEAKESENYLSGSPNQKFFKETVDILESYVVNIDKTLNHFKVKDKVFELLTDLKTSDKQTDFDTYYKLLNTGTRLFLYLDDNNSFFRVLKNEIALVKSNEAKIILSNSQYYDKIAGEKLSALPKAGQRNVKLESEFLKIVSWPAINKENTILVDKDWLVKKDDKGVNFKRTLKALVTGKHVTTGDCLAQSYTFVQYFNGKTFGKAKIENVGNRYFVSCTLTEQLSVTNGTAELPIADFKDDALEQKLIAAVRKKGTGNYQITSAIITSRNWAVQKNNMGNIISRSRIAAITYKDSNGKCFYENHIFKQNYSNGNYTALFITDSYGKKGFNCSQLK
jgi:hypothetical protein